MRSSLPFSARENSDRPRRHLTASETASVLGVTAASVRRWVGMGLLPAIRVGPSRRILIHPDDLQRVCSTAPGRDEVTS